MNKFPMIIPATAVLLLFAVIGAATPPSSKIVRLTLQENNRGAITKNKAQEQTTKGAPAPVNISGELSFDRRSGLSINGMPISFDSQTNIFPDPGSGRLPSPSSLNGKTATVLGVQSPGGMISARLVLISEPGHDGGSEGPNPVESWQVPADSGSPVGELTDVAPR
jgi:hypothetical protein